MDRNKQEYQMMADRFMTILLNEKTRRKLTTRQIEDITFGHITESLVTEANAGRIAIPHARHVIGLHYLLQLPYEQVLTLLGYPD